MIHIEMRRTAYDMYVFKITASNLFSYRLIALLLFCSTFEYSMKQELKLIIFTLRYK